MKSRNEVQSVIALDLEGTLHSNAVSQIPRPGLYAFLAACKAITPRVVIYTTVNEERFREIANALVSEKVAPAWFSDIEFVTWAGATKDLRFIPESNLETTVLLDDFVDYVHPDQKSNWIEVKQFGHPYDDNDAELKAALSAIKNRISG